MSNANILAKTKSVVLIKTPNIAELTMTIIVEYTNSCLVDHDTFFNSTATSTKKFLILANTYFPPGLVGLEPTTHGFGDRCSTN